MHNFHMALILIYCMCMIENIIMSAGLFCCGCLGGCCVANCSQPPHEVNETLEEENNMLRNFIYDMTPRRWRSFTRTNSDEDNRPSANRTPEVTPRVMIQASAPSCEVIHANAEYINDIVELNGDSHITDRN